MGHLIQAVLALTFLLSAVPASAQVYQYFDEEGTLIVTDNPFGISKPKPSPVRSFDHAELEFRDDLSYDTYTVYGKTFQDAMLSTKINGPFDLAENKRFAARTQWRIGWSYNYESSFDIQGSEISASLQIHDVIFQSDINVLLPRLAETSIMDSHDQHLWKNFIEGLLDHEHDHVDIILNPYHRNAATQKINAIRQLTIPYDPRTSPRESLRRAVEHMTAEIGHDLIMQIRRENEEYDRLTDHGLNPEMREAFFRRHNAGAR